MLAGTDGDDEVGSGNVLPMSDDGDSGNVR